VVSSNAGRGFLGQITGGGKGKGMAAKMFGWLEG